MCNVSEPLDSPLRQRIRAERTKGEKHPEQIGMAFQVCEEPFVIPRPSSRILKSHTEEFRSNPLRVTCMQTIASSSNPSRVLSQRRQQGLAHSPADYAFEAIARYGCYLYWRR
jgi:hypothetical protein